MNKRFQTPQERRALWLWLADALGPAAVQAGDILRMYEHPQILFEEPLHHRPFVYSEPFPTAQPACCRAGGFCGALGRMPAKQCVCRLLR